MNVGVGDVHMHVCNTDARGAPGRRVLRGKGSTGMGDRETGDREKISCQERKGGPLGVNAGLHPPWPALMRSATWGH